MSTGRWICTEPDLVQGGTKTETLTFEGGSWEVTESWSMFPESFRYQLKPHKVRHWFGARFFNVPADAARFLREGT